MLLPRASVEGQGLLTAVILLLEHDTPDALVCWLRSCLLVISILLVSAGSRGCEYSYATNLSST